MPYIPKINVGGTVYDVKDVRANCLVPSAAISPNSRATYDAATQRFYSSNNFPGITINAPEANRNYRLVFIPDGNFSNVDIGIMTSSHSSWITKVVKNFIKGEAVAFDFTWTSGYSSNYEICFGTAVAGRGYLCVYDITGLSDELKEYVNEVSATGLCLSKLSKSAFYPLCIETVSISSNSESRALYDPNTGKLTAIGNFPGIVIGNPVANHTYRVVFIPTYTADGVEVGILPASHSSWKDKQYVNVEKGEPVYFDFPWQTDYASNYEICFGNARQGFGYICVYDITSVKTTDLPFINAFSLDSLIISTPYNCYTKEQTRELMKMEAGKTVLCYGDSMTFSWGKSEDSKSYPNVLASLISDQGFSVINYGIGGETAMAIGMRQGGMPLYARPFTMAAGEQEAQIELYTDCDYPWASLGIQGTSGLSPCKLIASDQIVEGQISYHGEHYFFSRNETGAVLNVDRPVKVKTIGSEDVNQILLIWAGTNDLSGQAVDISEKLITIIENMVEYNGNDRYIVIGLADKYGYSDVDDVNKALARKFGIHFIDLKSYMLLYGLSDEGLTPTDDDRSDISNGIVPRSLRHDAVHFNDYGYDIVAHQVYLRGKQLGFWE